ncbi:MAG TPA: nucleoside deaminase [Candidatus Methylomirabilis sp.]|nr:nucleoside deaminase [Candidatus Methylomirabilis sp.]
MRYPEVVLRLPAWVEEFLRDRDRVYPTVEDRMRLVIELARMNVTQGTGGPFAAGIFDREAGRLLAPGVNLVVPARCAMAHAEVVAIMLAEQMVGHVNLGGPGVPPYELVCSTEPCAMCLGAVPWSGVRRLVCGARDEDARRVGFDEGEKAPNWIEAFEGRGIAVVRDVCRDDAAGVLTQCARDGGIVYNGR